MVRGNDPGFVVCHQEVFTRTKRTLKEPPRGRAGREGAREGRDRPGETEREGGKEGQRERNPERRKRETGSRPRSIGGALGLRAASGAAPSFQLRALRAACNPPTPPPCPLPTVQRQFCFFGLDTPTAIFVSFL